MDVIVVGEVVLDRVHAPDGTVTEIPGGSPANVAVALQRAGVATSLRARLSRDAAGRQLKAHLLSVGIDLHDAPDVDEPALVVDVVISSTGVPAYTFHVQGAADLQWTDDELSAAIPPGTQVIHTGSLAASMQPAGPRIRNWAVRTHLPITYDINVRPSLWSEDADRIATVHEVDAWVRCASIIKASDEDIASLYPDTTWQRWAEHASEGRLLVVTCGADGCRVWRDGSELATIPADNVDVIDTVGAGDTFMAWLIRGVLQRAADTHQDLPQALTSLSADALAGIATRATRAAGITCSRRGCDPPSAAEVS